MAYINHGRFVSTNTHPYAGQVSTSQGRHVSDRRGTELDCKRKEATVKLLYQAGTSAIFLPACTKNYRIKISPVPAYTLFFFSGMLNETNEKNFYYKTNYKKKTKKLRTPDQRFNARVAFWKLDHRKNPSVVALVQGTNVRTDGVANSRGQGNETGIDWECRKKTRRPESYPALVKARLPVMLQGWEESLGQAAAWCETKCRPDPLW